MAARAVEELYMLRNGGDSIINTAYMSAHIVNVPRPQYAYNASKAAVIQLTKSLAIEWAKRGVRVNSISSGYIGTELTLNSPALIPLIEKWNEMAPLGRMGRPEELESIFGIANYVSAVYACIGRSQRCIYFGKAKPEFCGGSIISISGYFVIWVALC